MKLNCYKLFLLITTFTLLASCDADSVIPEEKFIKVYVDLLIMQDTTMTNKISIDSIKTIVFNKHNISSEQYESTISNYNSSPEKWEEFFNSAIAFAEKLRAEAEPEKINVE